jgi:S1-C subfamily serine protease
MSKPSRVCLDDERRGLVPCRIAALAVLTAAVAIAYPSPSAYGQQAPWGWAPADHATSVWTSQNLADYLLTGHTPHPAVVRIVAPEQSSTSLGSGVLVDVNRNQGLVLTNWHVVRESKSAVLVQFADGFQSAGTVVRWDEAWDLAALVIWKPKATPVRLADAPPAVGDMLTIAGFGRGPYREETGPCTEYLSPGSGYPNEFVELRARARQGDSGGPIFNARGELAGVLFGESDGHTIGSCSTRVKTFLAAVGSQGFVPTPIAEFSDAPAIARGIGHAARHEAIADAGDVPIRRSAQDDSVSEAQVALGQTQRGQGQGEVTPEFAGTTASNWLRGWAGDSSRRPDFLAAAGGVALVVLGMRVLFGGRRSTPQA